MGRVAHFGYIDPYEKHNAIPKSDPPITSIPETGRHPTVPPPSDLTATTRLSALVLRHSNSSTATSLTLVSLLLAPLCHCHANARRKRLKTWYAQRNRTKRRPRVHSCFATLLHWITTGWSAPVLLLAMDATTIRDRWIVLSIRVLYKKRAVPAAWRVLAWDKQTWNPPLDAVAPCPCACLSTWRAGVG